MQAHKAFKKHKAEILLYVDRMDLVRCTLPQCLSSSSAARLTGYWANASATLLEILE